MRFAIVQAGGTQQLVKEGDTLRVNTIAAEPGKSVTFEALLIGDDEGKDVKVGMPLVAGASVTAEVLSHGMGKKVSVVKYKPKVRYARNVGHRQDYTEIKITNIAA